MNVFVSTHPFGEASEAMFNEFNNHFDCVRLNPLGHKLSSEQLAAHIGNADYLIAGTEKITEEVLNNARHLKMIARVGIGLDGVPFELCRERGIRVSYTPEAPTVAVGEFTVALMLEASRMISRTDHNMRQGNWNRFMGSLLYGKTIGLLGVGRIGKTVANMLKGFNVKLLGHDINVDHAFFKALNIQIVTKEELLRNSDIISLHIPLNEDTVNYVAIRELSWLKRPSILINTARGGIVNEVDLMNFLQDNPNCHACFDVFEEEPYTGDFVNLRNITLSSHMAASTMESRKCMEETAMEEVIRFKDGQPMLFEVFSNA